MALLAVAFAGLDTVAADSRLKIAAYKNRPVAKVVALLHGMLEQLEKESREDEDIYDKMACWCETNEKEKKKSIQDAEKRTSSLTEKIAELGASSSQMNTELSNLENEVASNQAALDQATAIRMKQLAQFSSEEKELTDSISSLKAASGVLKKHASASFIQMPHSHILGIAAALQHEMQQHSRSLKGVLTHVQRRMVSSFIQAPESTPSSEDIFGVIRNMKGSFESNLKTTQKDEMANQKAYEELKAAKQKEIAAGQYQIESKTQELADTDEKLAHAKLDLEDTQKSLASDQEFLAMLKEKCSMTDNDWELRQKTRQQELGAVSKAIAVLDSDDAKDLFRKTFNPSFFAKRSSKSNSNRRVQASELLSRVANRLHSQQLASLSVELQLDAFVRVKKSIDDLVSQLLKQKADEIKHRDFCINEFNTNQMQTEKKMREKSAAAAKVEDLELTIKDLTTSIDTLKSEIAEMQRQLKQASQDRGTENTEFRTMVADQRQTQRLLQAALSVLRQVYDAKSGASAMMQKQEPPKGFASYKKNSLGSPVIELIQQIMSDSKEEESDAIRSEEGARKAYEALVKNTNAAIKAKSNDIISKSDERSREKSTLVQTKREKESISVALENLSDYNEELHQSCDFVMKNFELRQTARDEEVEALRQAKAILSGAKFTEFLESA